MRRLYNFLQFFSSPYFLWIFFCVMDDDSPLERQWLRFLVWFCFYTFIKHLSVSFFLLDLDKRYWLVSWMEKYSTYIVVTRLSEHYLGGETSLTRQLTRKSIAWIIDSHPPVSVDSAHLVRSIWFFWMTIMRYRGDYEMQYRGIICEYQMQYQGTKWGIECDYLMQ